MDLQRLFLFLIFVFSLGLVWDGWQRYQHPERFIQQGVVINENIPKHQESASIAATTATIAQQPTQKAAEKIIHVKTDIFEAEISTVGGDISHLAFLKHPDGLDKNKPLVLFHRGVGTHNYYAQSGLLGAGMPNHNTLFLSEHDQYELSGNAEQLQVRLYAEGESLLKTIKVITFHKGSYLVDVSYDLENTGIAPVPVSSYFQLVRDSIAPAGSSRFLPTFTGVAAYTDKEKFKKVKFTEIENGKAEYDKQADDGWIGILQHYFIAAWLPKEKTKREYFMRRLEGDSYSAGVIIPEQVISPGQNAVISMALYAGPAQAGLDAIAPGLGLTVDYGWLTIIAKPLFWVMTLFNDWTHNWGISIILLTVLIKLLFFPLSAASYRSMAKMRIVAPKLEKIKEQHGSDREQLNRAMMELYKTEKINPLGGCLPVVVQIPVFIALYWSILSSVEMRYAPFFGWITDLSQPDLLFTIPWIGQVVPWSGQVGLLPLMMGASMIIQARLNPKPADPMQAKIMQVMPIAFSVIFFFFPAGLVLYSVVNNILSIGQQWYISKAAEDESKAVSIKR